MKTEYQDDMLLARRVAAGEASAFAEFYAQHADPVFAFVLHRVGGARADAEEIWQDTLVAAVRALPSYQGESRLLSWLCGIARRKIADRWRRSARQVQTVTTVAPDDLRQQLDGGVLPAALLNQDATRARVVEALAELPADYRVALTARYADGDSVEQVAHRLGRTYKATESLLSRAKAAFREALARI